MANRIGRPPAIRPICPQCNERPLKRLRAQYCGKSCSNAARARPMADRYWALVERHDDGCWGWTGCVAGNGYPILINDDGRQVSAHRVGYELQVGPIATGMMVLHHCDNPICSRGDHLFVGTAADNMRDMVSKRRSLAGERHPNAVLTETCVREMRELRSYGLSLADLADRFGVTKYTVADVCLRRSWRHLD